MIGVVCLMTQAASGQTELAPLQSQRDGRFVTPSGFLRVGTNFVPGFGMSLVLTGTPPNAKLVFSISGLFTNWTLPTNAIAEAASNLVVVLPGLNATVTKTSTNGTNFYLVSPAGAFTNWTLSTNAIADAASNRVVVLPGDNVTVSKTSTNGTNFYTVSGAAGGGGPVVGLTNIALHGVTNSSQWTWRTNALNEGTDGSHGGYVSSNFVSFSATNQPVQWLELTNNRVFVLATNLTEGNRTVELWLIAKHFHVATNREIIFPSTWKMMSGGHTNTLWSNRTARVTLRCLGGDMNSIYAFYVPESFY